MSSVDWPYPIDPRIFNEGQSADILYELPHPLTVEHLLVECPSMRDERRTFSKYGRNEDGFKLDLILNDKGDFSLRGLFGFLINCRVLDKL